MDESYEDLTELAMAARLGDEDALELLVLATLPRVRRVCARLLEPASADDLAQETYVRALRSLPSFRADASVMTWLMSIARCAVADEIRQRTRHRRLVTALTSTTTPRGHHPDDPAEACALDDALAGLDPDRRAAFVLTQMDGLSYAEAAEECACPVGTIRSRVARARSDLIDQWQDADVPVLVGPG